MKALRCFFGRHWFTYSLSSGKQICLYCYRSW